ncbi:hypothetical protein CDD81_6640 [Ophiocordyceps australis]|uniref:Glycoside hydrolase family 12 protein n=1 Tax=Ophiocordyceps australis TaxID=1399860 RepID=A0A2C5Y5Y9_9HYPO|nr:hypothetical protein CDD81_6640 [Ophiocordyceps australis]
MFRWLVNVGLLVLPIAVTLGILLGLQSSRSSSGQSPLFSPPIDNKWVEKMFCQKSFGIHPETKGQQYTLNPNQWAWQVGDPGFLCMNVTTLNNQTYPSKTMAPQFKVFWQYPQRDSDQPVHAFPNIKIDGGALPAVLQKINAIKVDMAWSMRLDNKTDTATDVDELLQANVNSNVAIDMFLDRDKSKAQDSEEAKFEVMVWFAAIGPATFAIGQQDGAVSKKSIDGTDFDLFFGQNGRGQNVLTWKSKTAAHDFHGDIGPLVAEILQSNRDNFPSASDYLGYLSFGSEAYHSNKPVTFSVPSLSIDIQKS